MGPRHYFRDRRTKLAGTGSYTDVVFGPVQPGRRYHIGRFAVEAETTAPTGDIRVFADGHGYPHYLLEQDLPAVDTLYWENEPTFLTEGESLTARFTGAAANDVLQLYVEGWWVELDNPGHLGRRPITEEMAEEAL